MGRGSWQACGRPLSCQGNRGRHARGTFPTTRWCGLCRSNLPPGSHGPVKAMHRAIAQADLYLARQVDDGTAGVGPCASQKNGPVAQYERQYWWWDAATSMVRGGIKFFDMRLPIRPRIQPDNAHREGSPIPVPNAADPDHARRYCSVEFLTYPRQWYGKRIRDTSARWLQPVAPILRRTQADRRGRASACPSARSVEQLTAKHFQGRRLRPRNIAPGLDRSDTPGQRPSHLHLGRQLAQTLPQERIFRQGLAVALRLRAYWVSRRT